MAFTVSVGEADFAALREKNAYYVDKTEIIYELVHDTNNKVSLFTRPRRFGKTLTISMMENFFSIRKDSRAVFDGLAITGHEEFCREWMNQYPVLRVSFKDVEEENCSVHCGEGMKHRQPGFCPNCCGILSVIMITTRTIIMHFWQGFSSAEDTV